MIDTSMLRPYFWAVLMNMKRVQSKQEAQLYDFGPLASILFDRGISSRVHSYISCSLMSTVRISSVKRKVFGGG